jgi:HEAT repeat protein
MSRTTLLLSLLSGISFFNKLKNVFSSRNTIIKMKTARDVRGLIRLLSHDDPDIQYEAAEALGNIGDVSAVGPLISALKTGEISGVRWKAAEALAMIGPPSVDPLIDVLQYPDVDVRWKAAIALGEIGDPRAIGPLIRCLSDKDRFVIGRSALALGMIGKPAVEPLIRALQEGDGNLRWGAAIALGKAKDPDAVVPLIHALADKYENVRAEAVSSLAAIGKPAIAPLIRFLKYAGGTARIEMMNALGELQANDAIEPLVQLLEKGDEEERRAVAGALDAILIPSVEPLVKRLWNGNDRELRGDGVGQIRAGNDNGGESRHDN